MRMSVRYRTGMRRHRCSAQRMRAPTHQQSSSVRDALYDQSGTQTGDTAAAGMATVAPRSSLPPNANSAPANPRAVVNIADARAQGYLDSAAVLTNLASFAISQGINMTANSTLQAYQDRFGDPQRVGRRYRNRFTGHTYAHQADAQAGELDSLSNRYQQMSDYLGAGIRYITNSNTRIRIGRCRDRCSSHPAWAAWSCNDRRAHAIALCAPYWTLPAGDSHRGIAIVHELAHLRLQLLRHNAGNQWQRGRNPECYASFVADLFGITPFDGQCPPT